MAGGLGIRPIARCPLLGAEGRVRRAVGTAGTGICVTPRAPSASVQICTDGAVPYVTFLMQN